MYKDNILHHSGPLFQQWVLRTQINIEEMRLQFLDVAQRKRFDTVADISQAPQEDGAVDPVVGRFLLPNSVKNYGAYWKQKRLYVQAIVARSGRQAFFITVTMNPRRE